VQGRIVIVHYKQNGRAQSIHWRALVSGSHDSASEGMEKSHVMIPFSPKILNEYSLQIIRSSLHRSVTNQQVLMGFIGLGSVVFASSVHVSVKTTLTRSFVLVHLDLFIQLIKKFLCYATQTFRHLVTISGSPYVLDNMHIHKKPKTLEHCCLSPCWDLIPVPRMWVRSDVLRLRHPVSVCGWWDPPTDGWHML
jgi:hypothetical protein